MTDLRIRAALLVVAVISLLPAAPSTLAVERTVGALQNDPGAFEGYTLFTPMQSRFTYLVDNQGLLVHTWESQYTAGFTCYLLDNGDLLRAANPGGTVFLSGGSAGLVERFDWDGALLWSYLYSNADHRAHHDIEPLPNGNVLILAWERRTIAEAVAAGRNPATMNQGALWPEHLVEVAPTGPASGDIVWEWHVWDHLVQDFDPARDNFGVVAEHPELIDINHAPTPLADWLHCNSVDYHAALDQIVISCPRFAEVWIIDHSTTTAEAAGHAGGARGRGGDLLYRWGNPATYRAGAVADQKLFNQHQTEWIEPGAPGAGNLLIFNNGTGRPDGNYSSVEEIVTPIDGSGDYDLAPGAAYGPAAALSTFTADPPTSFFAGIVSGAQRLPNGNTLICDGPPGIFFEVDGAGETIWRYRSPDTTSGPLAQGDPVSGAGAGQVFRVTRLAPDHPGLAGRDLTPNGTIELYSCPADTNCDDQVNIDDVVTVVLGYGECTGLCLGDVTRDGRVDIDDVVTVILGWGGCP